MIRGARAAHDVDRPRGDSAVHARRIPARRRANPPSGCCACSARWFGWAPGGTAVAAATLCAFFTLFTGGSGVTILALGGLLLPALIADGYRERFSIGLLTASGSLGLLFPLSLPLMLYGIVAQKAAIEDLFIGGILPGLLMLGLLGALGVREGVRQKTRGRCRSEAAKRSPRSGKRSGSCCCRSSSSATFFGGVATLVESAPMAALYTLIVQRFIHRDLPTWQDVLRVMSDCVALVGGVLLILAVAAGLTDYFMDARRPDAADRVDAGARPLDARLPARAERVPAARRHGDGHLLGDRRRRAADPAARRRVQIDPVHLGIIFVANLELGFLHPPLGLNLLLASIRFKKPVLEVTWATLPMLGILAIGVLLITYVPWLTTGLLEWMGRTAAGLTAASDLQPRS